MPVAQIFTNDSMISQELWRDFDDKMASYADGFNHVWSDRNERLQYWKVCFHTGRRNPYLAINTISHRSFENSALRDGEKKEPAVILPINGIAGDANWFTINRAIIRFGNTILCSRFVTAHILKIYLIAIARAYIYSKFLIKKNYTYNNAFLIH